MVYFHSINPVALQIGFLKIRWYSLMYLLGFGLAWLLGRWRAQRSQGDWNQQQVSDLVFYGALGLMLGGRIGYMLFYNWSQLLADPIVLFKPWQGGMSFHGGLIGGAIACYLFARRHGKTFFAVTDFALPLVPLGLAAGRLGNFINGELWGRVTTLPWGIIYPQAGPLPRHPSQLYELFLEGMVLFILIWWYSSQSRPTMSVSGLFLVSYGCLRFGVEFFREPDPQLNFVFADCLTQGQMLCLPMIVFGLGLLLWAYKKHTSCRG